MGCGVIVFILVTACVTIQAFKFDSITAGHVMDEEWKLFKTQYKKSYKNDVEESLRARIWMDNRRMITEHNQKGSYKMGMNHFGDMTSSERMSMNGLRINQTTIKSTATKFIAPAFFQAPDSIDWRAWGAVSYVKNQGQCGSCWAFGAAESVEGQHFRQTGALVSLSEQDLLDCVPQNYGGGGCNGGDPYGALIYLRDSQGVDTESSYPYQGAQGSCAFSAGNVGATVTGAVHLQGEDNLKNAVASIGPIVAAIDCEDSLFSYSGGIYSDSDCQSDQASLNHAVLVVGYGTEDGQDYWIVKNSWGADWGENGYFRMARNANNNCGIATYNVYPLV